MKKIRSSLRLRRTVRIAERWPQGWADLVKEAEVAGFEPWVPAHSRLFADWSNKSFAVGPASWTEDSDITRSSFYAYIGRDVRLSLDECESQFARYSFVVLDERHALASDLKNSNTMPNLVVVTAAEAFVDWLARNTWCNEWLATEMISPEANISKLAHLEPGVIVGPNSVIEDGAIVCAGARIGEGVRIGKNTKIGAYSVILDHVQVGNDVVMGSHCVLGGPGLGLVKYPNSSVPIQRIHVGTVCIADRVRMGAYVSVDRGVFDDTVVGADTQIDNHVQIAHNCNLGEGNVLCAFVGLAGSTDVGSRTTLAGMVGTKGHLSIGSDVIVGAQSGVSRSVRDGEQVKGYPVRDMAEAAKIAVLTTKLPDIYERLKILEKSLKGDK